jgi:hypothetical protein
MRHQTTDPLSESASYDVGQRREQSSVRRSPLRDALQYFEEYARENPRAAALWCFGIGFVLGWKLKPW